MPRDGNGNYTLPAGNPVIADTVIASTWANDTMNDMANEMQDSLSRSGKGGLTAPLGVVDFSGSTPGVNFTAEPTSGLKRETTEDVRIQVTTTDVLRCTKTGVQVLSGGSLKDVVVEETGQKVMRGVGGTTVCYFYNDTPPAGWTLEEPDANVRELVIGPSGAGQGGQIGGSVDPTNLTGTVNVTSLTATAQNGGGIPGGIPFSATTGFSSSNGQVASQPGSSFARETHDHTVSGNTDAVADHTHTVTGTGTGDVTITPRYARGLLAKLNA